MEILTLRPDGASPRVETLAFRTTMTVSRNGKETRVATRAHPRVSLQSSYFVTGTHVPSAVAHLRAGGSVLVPLHHAALARAGDTFTQRGTADASYFPTCIAVSNHGEHTARTATAPTLVAPAHSQAWPALEMQLSSDYAAESRLHSLHSVALSLEAVEPVTAYSPSLRSGSPALAPKFLVHNFVYALSSMTATDSDVFDAGFVIERRVRFQKCGLKLNIALRGKEQIDAFRLWVCQLQGACGEFLWTPPGRVQARRWRLGSDSVAIQHRTADYATVQLTVISLGVAA